MKVLKILIPVFTIMLAISGCSDPCKEKECGAGICEDGDCQCDPGWSRDADGKCTVQDLCYQKNCGEHGQCNLSTGNCDCQDGWLSDGGNCNKQDPCYQKDCGTHGHCNATTGNCDCDFGYEQDTNGKCTMEVRQKYIGTWSGSHTNDIGQTTGPYTMEVEAVPGDVTKLLVKNFMDYYCNVLSQPMRVYATIGVYGVDYTSLCSTYETDGNNDAAYLLSTDILKVNVFLTSGGSGWNLEGIYQRQ